MQKAVYEQGETLQYLGQDYFLKIKSYKSYKTPGIMLEDKNILVLAADSRSETVKEAVRTWYTGQAKFIIPKRVSLYCGQLKEEVNTIRIKDVKSRWGSCSTKRNLNFNWRLVMAPLPVLDYVVIHELCHLKEMNHSKAFWGLVEEIQPEYRHHREWLKKCSLIQRY